MLQPSVAVRSRWHIAQIGVLAGLVLLSLFLAGSGVIGVLPRLAPYRAITTTTVSGVGLPRIARDPYTHRGVLALNDPLSDNSKGYKWREYAVNCIFTGRAYQAIAPDANYVDYCIADFTDFSNFVFEVQMKVIKGDAGGLVFRTTFDTTTSNNMYQLYISQDGSYGLIVNKTKDLGPSVIKGSSPAINTGLNQTNLVAIVADGNNITIYVNHQRITSVADSTYSHGQIGVWAVPLNNPTTVVYSNAKVWVL